MLDQAARDLCAAHGRCRDHNMTVIGHLDQFLFVRPVAGAAQYRLPLDGLFLCGAGAHPGGGVSGAAGRNAAMTILARDKSR